MRLRYSQVEGGREDEVTSGRMEREKKRRSGSGS